jgi:hypothetical protein
MENEFPPNSHTRREPRPERKSEKSLPEKKQVARVTTGKATLRKRPLYKKFLDAFRPEDNVGFVEYTLLEVLVPGIKDAMADAVHGTIDNAFGTHGRSRHYRRRGYTSYNRMSDARPRSRRDRDRDRDDIRDRRAPRGPSDHREIIVDSRVEAEEVVDSLIELASKYDAATMRDLLSLVGEPHNYTDEDWGWTDLRGTRIHRVRDGYLIDLPRPEELD